MLIQINTYVLVMVLNSICVQNFSLPDGSVGKNDIIQGVDIRSSVHIVNKKKDNLIFGLGPTQQLDNTTLTTEAQDSITFSRSNRKFCLNQQAI